MSSKKNTKEKENIKKKNKTKKPDSKKNPLNKKKKENKEFEFKNEYIGYIIIIIGLIITAFGLCYMFRNIYKYRDYDIINSYVTNYKVKTEGVADQITSTSYIYTVKYEIDGASHENVLPKYIETERHFGDTIAITVRKDNRDKIDIFVSDNKGTIIAIVGISISILGFLVYIIINKFIKK